jgi:hypothetical protein
MIHQATAQVGDTSIVIETGKLAKLADGAVTVRCGDTILLVSAVSATSIKEGQDWFPLTVDYREKASAVGRFPGGYFKREGRPTEKETLVSRLIDRPVRPLFADGWRNETQVIVTTLSHDLENDPDILAMIASSAALTLSGAPFMGPIGAARGPAFRCERRLREIDQGVVRQRNEHRAAAVLYVCQSLPGRVVGLCRNGLSALQVRVVAEYRRADGDAAVGDPETRSRIRGVAAQDFGIRLEVGDEYVDRRDRCRGRLIAELSERTAWWLTDFCCRVQLQKIRGKLPPVRRGQRAASHQKTAERLGGVTVRRLRLRVSDGAGRHGSRE